ncbi:MAG: hypothetical protein F4Z31_05320 [Gemmatimonadetes bacterium]|nr:hypothetical protein [Gemmatimonadota bacterium]
MAGGELPAEPDLQSCRGGNRIRKFLMAMMAAAIVIGAWSTAETVATSKRQDGLNQLCAESERDHWFSNGWNCSRAGDNRERGKLFQKMMAPSFGAAAVFLVVWRTRDRHREKIVIYDQDGHRAPL